MRKIEYLSPTSLSLFYENLDEFYVKYLTEHRSPAPPQTTPMAVGSSFDAYVKNYLYENLFGKNHNPKYNLSDLFEAQVEKHNRDIAWDHGKYVFDVYKKSGALADLMLELTQAIGTPKFEMEIKGVVSGYREGVTKDIEGVVFLGKPDVFYINKFGCHVILDFKVNGFYGYYKTSPMKGYLKLRDITGTYGRMHRECVPFIHKGTTINVAHYLESLNASWATQLSIYAWLCGTEIGEDYVVAIDQVCCDGTQRIHKDYPEIKIAEHRLRVHPDYQYNIYAKGQHAWEIVHSNHIFRNLSLEESINKCKQLDTMAEALCNGSDDDKWFYSSSRK